MENFIRTCEISQKSKMYRQNHYPLVITKSPRTPFDRIKINSFDCPTRNDALTIRDELSKFTQAYHQKDKKQTQSSRNFLNFFQYYTIMKDLCELCDFKVTFFIVNLLKPNGSIERFHAIVSEMRRSNTVENRNEHSYNVLPYAVICFITPKMGDMGLLPISLFLAISGVHLPKHHLRK